MNPFMFGYCATVITALLWPSLLTTTQAWCCVAAALIIIRWSKLLAGGVFALAWVSLFSHQLLALETSNDDATISVRAEIISLVQRNSDQISVDIRVLDDNSYLFFNKFMRLEWQVSDPVSLGEEWLLTLKPKSISSPLNQGGFNRQRYYLGHHIIGKGKVVAAQQLRSASGLRFKLIERLRQQVSHLANGDLMLALMLGDKQQVSEAHWQGLRQSGTGHLISISGLHLSVLALWCVGLARYALNRWRLASSMTNWHLAGIIALVMCSFYAYLAGFALPTQRALTMLLLVIALGMLRRFSAPFERLLWALFIVLVLDPLSIMSAGFWLSFGALAIILWFAHRQQKRGSRIDEHETGSWRGYRQGLWQKLAQLWSIQWRLSLLLGLLQGLLFGGIAPYSLIFNLVFVPWFSVVVIPLTFAVMLMWGLADLILSSIGLSSLSMAPLLSLLDSAIMPLTASFSLLGSLPLNWVALPANVAVALIFALLGVFLLQLLYASIIPALTMHAFLNGRVHPVPLKRAESDGSAWDNSTTKVARVIDAKLSVSAVIVVGILLLPSLLLLLTPRLAQYDKRWALHLLDVGQGLSAVVIKQGRAVVYDTGAAFGSQFSYAKYTVIPFLQRQGITEVDFLFLSHGDNDHAGGADVLISMYAHTQVVTDLDHPGAIACRPQRWHWQGLVITLLGPQQPQQGNNGSCIVRIGDDRHQVLLPGDIEVEAEQQLIERAKRQGLLMADISQGTASRGDGVSDDVTNSVKHDVNNGNGFDDASKDPASGRFHGGLRSSILVAPHHGSNTSSSEAFIRAVSPAVVLYAAGLNNRYGFPKVKVIERYQMAEVEQYAVGHNGQLSVIFDQDDVKIKGYRYDFAPFWYNRTFEFGQMLNTE
ncbi:DNA internalization-related competence protein ComEC/Rec2 [Shewanella algidipiscicola]|uniref:DNA internalization-related competence protein ComEC/Rec2 n=1 Tax=Shewanella algidipiscicola TaxID=614070 RepID=UPI000D783621|nr:DNA internalization-related competence protein ComEC/Rec2 [Shewanella algidipiscicola]